MCLSKKLLWLMVALCVTRSTIVGSGCASAAPAAAPTGAPPRNYDDLAAELAETVASAAAAAAAAAAVASTDAEQEDADADDDDWPLQQKRMGGSPVDVAPIVAVMRAGYEAQRDALIAMHAASRQRLNNLLNRMRQQGK